MIETWHHVFGAPGEPLTWWQMSSRTILLFCYGLILFRIGARRMLAGSTAFDTLVVIILGSNLSRALTGNAPLLPVMASSALLVALHWGVAALTFYSHTLGLLAKGSARPLVSDGSILWRKMRRGMISREDLEESLRLKGIGELSKIKAAYLERNGEISAITKT
jgi:uncharacterized membrane protein YcaP (DUF421 family)